MATTQESTVPPGLANTPGPLSAPASSALSKKRALKKTFEKKFCGFRFTTLDENLSMLGMLYHSRTPITESNAALDLDENSMNFNPGELASSLGSSFSVGSDDSDDEEEDSHAHNLNPRQQLAMTVKNWSKTRENDKSLLDEGAVQALIALTATEDPLIKKWCAVAIYNLSTRAENRKQLLDLGAAGGIISVANNSRNWKSAKLCAMTLCNLSIESGGEETLLAEHAQISLVSFLSVRGHFLLPICAQALYNLTHVSKYSNSLERVIKALMNLPTLPGFYDPNYILLKSIVNCTRFPELHSRIIEDSCFTTFINALMTLPQKSPDIALDVFTFIRALSESEKRRMDLIVRGPVKLLDIFNDYADNHGRRQLIKAMSNIVDCQLTFPPKTVEAQLSHLIDICVRCIHLSEDISILQHALFALYALSRVQTLTPTTKFWPWCSLQSINRIIDIMEKCLTTDDILTQYYAILTCYNILFSDSR